jgi:hypothetical protein
MAEAAMYVALSIWDELLYIASLLRWPPKAVS